MLGDGAESTPSVNNSRKMRFIVDSTGEVMGAISKPKICCEVREIRRE
jgi:hypothetical protein